MDVFIIVFVILGVISLVIATPVAFECIKNIMLMRRQEKVRRQFDKDINEIIEKAIKESNHKMTMKELENLK